MDSILSLRKKLLRTLAQFCSPRCARPVTRRVRTLEFRNPAHKDTRVLQSAMRQTGHAARKAGHFCSPRCFSGVRARCFSGARHQVCSRKQRGVCCRIRIKALNGADVIHLGFAKLRLVSAQMTSNISRVSSHLRWRGKSAKSKTLQCQRRN